jgi:hypothetical protein
MRPNVDSQKIERLMQVLGREAQGSGCIYFTGGASALLIGWQSSTEELRDNFEAIAPELIRFPSLNPDVLRSRVENFIARFAGNSEERQS